MTYVQRTINLIYSYVIFSTAVGIGTVAGVIHGSLVARLFAATAAHGSLHVGTSCQN